MRSMPEFVILIACAVAAVSIIAGAGIDSHVGGSAPDTGAEEDFDEIEEDLQSFESDPAGADSMIGLAITSINLAGTLIGVVLLFPFVLTNLGVPSWIAFPASLPVWAAALFFLLGLLRGIGRLL